MQCYEVHAEIRRINSKITCYYSVQKLLSYSLFKMLKIRTKKNNFATSFVWVKNMVSYFEETP
jgi:hypothetical protein